MSEASSFTQRIRQMQPEEVRIAQVDAKGRQLEELARPRNVNLQVRCWI